MKTVFPNHSYRYGTLYTVVALTFISNRFNINMKHVKTFNNYKSKSNIDVSLQMLPGAPSITTRKNFQQPWWPFFPTPLSSHLIHPNLPTRCPASLTLSADFDTCDQAKFQTFQESVPCCYTFINKRYKCVLSYDHIYDVHMTHQFDVLIV